MLCPADTAPLCRVARGGMTNGMTTRSPLHSEPLVVLPSRPFGSASASAGSAVRRSSTHTWNSSLRRRLSSSDLGAEVEQVGQAEPARLGGGEGGAPARVDGPVGLAVGVDDADHDLADQPAADRAEAFTAGAVLGLLEQVEPERRLLIPAGRPEADLLGGERLHSEASGHRLA